ncbi:hypothetical protein K239x_11540 [Planctomycetes bacterium K23_9]|uniref:Uncharacterized protein n=1 Tax=Stieleria marina TaxID=1930275 RepID=A0A517NQ15_9BACT|nr:hypothetical protein K239x_11540 [Planctomycetes bacterium K23_9]
MRRMPVEKIAESISAVTNHITFLLRQCVDRSFIGNLANRGGTEWHSHRLEQRHCLKERSNAAKDSYFFYLSQGSIFDFIASSMSS